MNISAGATRRAAALVAIPAAVLALYWPAASALGEVWSDSARTTYTHGWLIAAISVWMLWRSRARALARDARELPAGMRVVAFVALAASVLSWQFAFRAGIQVGMVLLLLPLLWLPVLLILGRNAAHANALPIGYLAFAMPFWDYVNPLLQFGSVHAARFLLRLAGVPAYFHGNFVQLPDADFEIQGGCSGLHYFIVALALATLMGEVRGDGWRKRMRWLAIAAALAIFCNWFRIFSILLIGHLSHMQNYLVRVSHYGYGWVLFALAIFVLFLIERRTPLDARASALASPDAAPRAYPSAHLSIAGVSALLVLPLLMNEVVSLRLDAPRAAPAVAAGWQQTGGGVSDWLPVQLNADRTERARFQKGSAIVETYRAEYDEQRPGKKLGGYSNRPQGQADVLESGTQVVGDASRSYLIIEQDGDKSVVWTDYQVGERSFSNATRAQFWYAWRTLTSLRSPGSQMRAWRARCTTDCAVARKWLEEFTDEGGSTK